jgi:hypothetical protein
VVALILTAVSLYMNGGEWRKLVQEVLPNLIAGLLAFGSIYFLFTRRNMSIAGLTGENELRSEFRKYIIPAGRSLEQAMNRAAEAYSQISQDAGLHEGSENLASLTYYYQTMVKDIFLAYSTLMEGWVFLSADTDVRDPIIKAKAYIKRASEGRSVVSEKSRFATGASGAVFIAALKVLNIDLDSALRDLECAMRVPVLTHEAAKSEPNRTLHQTGPTSDSGV